MVHSGCDYERPGASEAGANFLSGRRLPFDQDTYWVANVEISRVAHDKSKDPNKCPLTPPPRRNVQMRKIQIGQAHQDFCVILLPYVRRQVRTVSPRRQIPADHVQQPLAIVCANQSRVVVKRIKKYLRWNVSLLQG